MKNVAFNLLMQKQTDLYSLPLQHNIFYIKTKLRDFSYNLFYYNYLQEQRNKQEKNYFQRFLNYFWIIRI